MTPLKSSNLEACAYDHASKKLTVKFRNGGTYHYHEVTHDHYEGLTQAESPGKYLNQHLRGRYQFKKADAA